MVIELLYLALGLALLIRPQWFAGIPVSRRQRRLAALEAGAAEAFFEEKRALETYPARRSGLGLWRLLGGLMVLTILALLLLPLFPTNT